VFLQNSDLFSTPYSTQYKSIIFFHNQDQLEIARQKLARLSEINKVYVEILAYTRFYRAEDYHQKYHLQSIPEFIKDLEPYYKNFQEFVDSTATARINGYMLGYGDPAVMEHELPLLGLSKVNQERINKFFFVLCKG
jgi:peptide-methionine (S)-S-oxide reductase